MIARGMRVLCLLAASGLLATAAAGEDEFRPPGRLVEVDGHRMHLYCTGIGSPTVVLDAGLGGSFLDWSRVQPVVGDYTRVCSYDRSGYGWSESGARPRTSGVIADELHALLADAGLEGPFVLVGHSFGGFNVRMFASRYPDKVAGLVFVDASQARQVERLEATGGPAAAPRGRFVVFTPARLPPNLPQRVQPMAEAVTYRATTNRTVYAELKHFRESAQEVRHAEAALPDVPMVVITRGRAEGRHVEQTRQREAVWHALQREFVARHPGTMHLIAEYSGHYVPLEQPSIVNGGICVAVQGARAGNGQWPRLPKGWLRQRCLASMQLSSSAWQP